jgi:Fur family ferric uptake transcriptional regulator
MKPAKIIFSQYLGKNEKLYSKQRAQILDIFLKTEKHLTVNELYNLVRKKHPQIGLATVYRTMKAICDAGLARETDFGDGLRRFEHKHKHRDHDHLICLKCGRIIEVMSPEIEKLQVNLARKHRFKAVRHRMEIFGLCRTCKSKEMQS